MQKCLCRVGTCLPLRSVFCVCSTDTNLTAASVRTIFAEGKPTAYNRERVQDPCSTFLLRQDQSDIHVTWRSHASVHKWLLSAADQAESHLSALLPCLTLSSSSYRSLRKPSAVFFLKQLPFSILACLFLAWSFGIQSWISLLLEIVTLACNLKRSK